MDYYSDEGTANAFAKMVEAWLQACGELTYFPYLCAMHGTEKAAFQASWIIYTTATRSGAI